MCVCVCVCLRINDAVVETVATKCLSATCKTEKAGGQSSSGFQVCALERLRLAPFRRVFESADNEC